MSKAIEVEAFDDKRVDEDVALTFDYTKQFGTGETISTATFTATVVKATDASPNNIISGAATISGSKATQLVINGIDGVKYLIKCIATTSQSQKLHGLGYLTVTNTVKPK